MGGALCKSLSTSSWITIERRQNVCHPYCLVILFLMAFFHTFVIFHPSGPAAASIR